MTRSNMPCTICGRDHSAGSCTSAMASVSAKATYWRCTKCKGMFPFAEFANRNNSYCTDCMKIYLRHYRNPEYPLHYGEPEPES